MNQFVCVCVCERFLFLKGKERVILPQQQGALEEGAGSNPWAEFHFFSKNSEFRLSPGRTEGDNSDRCKFPSEALSAKLLSFPSYFGDMKIPGGYLQPNMKAPFFFKQGKIIWLRFFYFFFLFLCAAQGMCCHFVPVPNLSYLHVFPGGGWLSLPLLNSVLALAQNHYKVGRTKNMWG